MDTMTSSEFRKRYATLVNDTEVTVLGRPIGVWVPHYGHVASLPGEMQKRERSFNSKPFTPAPKRGK